MGDATRPACSKVGGAETNACMDAAGAMDDNRPGRAESKVNILVRKK